MKNYRITITKMCPRLKTKLSTPEITLYFVIWISACLYSLHKLYKVQNEILGSGIRYNLKNLEPGWTILSRLKDTSDYEWTTFMYFFRKTWYYMILHVMVSEILRMSYNSWLRCWYIIETALFIINVLGVKQLFAVVLQPLIYYAVILFSGGKQKCVWFIFVVSLLIMHQLKNAYSFWEFFDYENIQDEEMFLLFIGLGWIGLRCISYFIHYIDRKEKWLKMKNTLEDKSVIIELVELYSYILYLPTLYLGPIILYDEFEKSLSADYSKLPHRFKYFFVNVIIYILYILIIELSFHYMYFFALQESMEIIRMLPCSALCGGGLWMGIQFHMKYVALYGLTTSVARVDNIDAPPTPRCICRIHIYSQMWRYFDVGLYRFLINYVYKPTISILSRNLKLSKAGSKQLSSLITFMFIYIWHGTTYSILLWSTLNYLGVSLEYLGTAIVETDTYKYFKCNILKTDRMEERFNAFICVPLFAMSAVSSFYLFSGYELGHLYFEYFTHPSLFNVVIVSLALYSCCHVSNALQDVPSRTVRIHTKSP